MFRFYQRPTLARYASKGKADIQFDNVDSILDEFRDLEDPRSEINRLHVLGDLIVMSIMAVVAGADGPNAIGI